MLFILSFYLCRLKFIIETTMHCQCLPCWMAAWGDALVDSLPLSFPCGMGRASSISLLSCRGMRRAASIFLPPLVQGREGWIGWHLPTSLQMKQGEGKVFPPSHSTREQRRTRKHLPAFVWDTRVGGLKSSFLDHGPALEPVPPNLASPLSYLDWGYSVKALQCGLKAPV